MSKPGNYTAYQQYKPLDNGTVQALQQWSSFAQQKQQADQLQEQKSKEFEYKANKDKQEEIDKWLSYDSIPSTGVDNVDKFNAKIMASDQDGLRKYVEELSSINPNSSRGLELRTIIKNVQGNPAKIKNIISAPLELAKKYMQGRGTEYVQTSENDAFFENLKNAEYTRNPETGEPAVIIKDPNNPENTKILTEAEALNLQSMVPLIPKFNWEKLVKENAEILNKKPPVTATQDPITGHIITSEGYQPDTIESIAKNMFSDDNGKPTEYAISFLKQKGITDKEALEDPEKLAELQNQFITDISPRLVDKNGIKTNTNRIQEGKARVDAEYKRAQLALKQQEVNLKTAVAAGKGELKKPVTLADFKKIPKLDGKGRIGFNVADNALIVSYGAKGNEVERKVTGIWINPKDRKEVKVTYIETGQRANALGSKQPYSQKKTFDSTTDGEMAGTFSAELGLTLEELHDSLMSKVPKPKTTTKSKGTTTPKTTTKKKTKPNASSYGL
jgi:hypothetical protein